MEKESDYTTPALSKDAQTALEPNRERTARMKKSHG
jgi:hypothetical protein